MPDLTPARLAEMRALASVVQLPWPGKTTTDAVRTAIPEMLDEIDHLYFLLSESQTDLENEREFRDADDQIAEMRADVLREEWQIARAERDALAAKVARVEALIETVEHRMMATAKPDELRAALAGEQ